MINIVPNELTLELEYTRDVTEVPKEALFQSA